MSAPRNVIILVCLCSLVMPGVNATAEELSRDHLEWPPDVFRTAYRLIATGEEMRAIDTLSGGALRHYLDLFWKRRDPTPTTDDNEFREQFRERVDHATTALDVTNESQVFDPRGVAYIKYGPPDQQEYRDDTRMPFAWFGLHRDSRMEDNQLWSYFGRQMTLQFEMRGSVMKHVPTDDPRYARSHRDFNRDRHRLAHDPVEYRPPADIKHLDLAIEVYPFRRTDGHYDVYLAVGSPLGPLVDRGGDQNHLEYTAHIVAFDTNLTRVWENRIRIDQQAPSETRGLMIQHQWAAGLPSGPYIFGVEIEEARGRKRAAATYDRWLVPYVSSAELDLSPLVLASHIEAADDGTGTFVRNGRAITPLPSRTYVRGQELVFYHEVYNLKSDEAGVAQYEIAYTLYDRRKDTKRALGTTQISSQSTDTFQAGRIPAAVLRKGEYILEVKTRDLVAGSTKTALAEFQVK